MFLFILREMIPIKKILKSLLFLSVPIMLTGSTTDCLSRRCLANKFIAEELFSPPQSPNCLITVNLTSIQYQTLYVDIQALRFTSRIKINMEWTDPDLAWPDTQYSFKDIMVPFDKIWTPNLTVHNAVYMMAKPVFKDALVRNDGTVNFAIVMYVTVGCALNLFTYPFVDDACPVAINGRNRSSCAQKLLYGSVTPVGSHQGEWQTTSVELRGDNLNYLYIMVSNNPFNGMVSLVLPSGLIMVADLVSFTLPLDGERNAFKIKLVFSFTMFLLMLSKQLPGNGPCSPLILYHFCFCLIVLVVSLLISMKLTWLAKNGSVFPKRFRQLRGLDTPDAEQEDKNQKKDHNWDITNTTELTTAEVSLRKISSFAKNMDKDTREKQRRNNNAKYWDNICFWTYLILDIIYSLSVLAFTKTKYCKINNLDF